MPTITSSATKITLLLLILTTCVGALWHPEVFFKTFDYAVIAVIAFYFGQKTNITPAI